MEEKLDWKELDAHITRSRIAQFRETRSVPSQFTFYKNHLFFLGVPRNSYDDAHPYMNTLCYIDLEEIRNGVVENEDVEMLNDDARDYMKRKEESQENIEADDILSKFCLMSFEWHVLLELDSLILTDSIANAMSPNYSKEEELLRERKRLSSHGITSYEFHQEAGRMLFAAGNTLYWLDVCDIVSRKSKEIRATEVPTSLNGSRMDAKICHRNPDIISFNYLGDIWVANLATGQELRLTFVRTPGRDDCVSAGIPSFVTQEEFDRFTGYWWEPKETKNIEDTDEVEVHKILYEMVDESMVERHHIVSTSSDFSTHVDTYRYPKAGSSNAQSSLRLVQFSVIKNSKEILDGSIFEHELRVELNELLPWVEYLVRCEWMSDGQSLWAQVLNRRQSRLALLQIPLSAFRVITSTCVAPAETPYKIRMILEEMSDNWINLSDIIYFLPSSNQSSTKLVWSSEKLGNRHLFLVTVANEKPCHTKDNSNNKIKDTGNHLHICDVLSNAELTEGPWEVSTSKIWVDEENQLLYFSGRKETPLEEHLYVTSYQYGCNVKRLTDAGLSHVTQLDEKFQWVVNVASSVTQMCQVQICKIQHENHKIHHVDLNVSLNPIGWLEEPRELKSDLFTEFFSYTNRSGRKIHGLLVRRKDLDLERKHPTILFVYGGPGVQLVTNSQKILRRAGLYSVTSLGYIAVMIDTVGSFHRGIDFEAVLKGKMGTVEIGEQVEGLEFITERSGIIDLNRIAVHGWSYGGYLSLMGLAQRPDVFKVAIAGAPVVAWELYDTGYTERYMDLPKNNPEGYKRGSVLNYISQFPDEDNRLLLVHGLIDENVHFNHTNLLINNLINEGKPYNLQIFPSERHGIRHSSAAQHFETVLLLFLQKNL